MLPTTSESVPRRRRARWALAALCLALVPAGFHLAVRPRTDRDWSPDMAVLPSAEVRGDTVRVRGVRNTEYRTTEDYTVRWEDRTVRLDRLESVWFLVEPFSDYRGPAHTLVSFGFADGQYLAISVELRRERGEHFDPLLGMLRRYELAYVIGDERDLIGLRANHRKDDVYLYPVRATPEQRRTMLLGMLERANGLRTRPEFYNTVTNNCTTNIARHVNAVAPGKVPLGWQMVLPAYADELAYDLGLLDTGLPLPLARQRFHVNARAERWKDSPEFSRRIRETPES
jgi:hypothetical protein